MRVEADGLSRAAERVGLSAEADAVEAFERWLFGRSGRALVTSSTVVTIASLSAVRASAAAAT